MRENRLRTLLSEGKPSFGTRVQSSWPTITELVGRSQNFDYVEFLAEYAPYDLYALDNIARAIELYPNFTGLIKIGPSDYSMSIGLAGQREHPAVVEAREHTIKTAIKMGVRPRAEIGSPAEAEYYLNLGVKDFNLSTDTAILSAFYRDQGRALRDLA